MSNILSMEQFVIGDCRGGGGGGGGEEMENKRNDANSLMQTSCAMQ